MVQPVNACFSNKKSLLLRCSQWRVRTEDLDPSVTVCRSGSAGGRHHTGFAQRRATGRFILLWALFTVAGGILIRPSTDQVTATSFGACNGDPALCDRRLDEVVFAGTHNAMGAAEVDGWLFPNQQRTIRRQLEDGIRALMIDVVAGVPVGDAVRTELESGTAIDMPLEDQSWGGRTFSIYDLNGFHLTLYQLKDEATVESA